MYSKIILKFMKKEAEKEARVDEASCVITEISKIRQNIGLIYERLNYVSDELITDSLNYELLALKTRHKYYTEKAKEMKITSM